MIFRNPLLFLSSCFLFLNVFAANDGYFFQSNTEDSTKHWMEPSEGIAQLIVGTDKLTRQLLDEKIKEDNLRANYRQFLAVTPIALSNSRQPYLFVRPKSDVYSPFYGAHTYRHFVMDGRHKKIIFRLAADNFIVTNTAHNNMRDIVSEQCFGGYCYGTTFIYDKEKNVYVEGSCMAHVIVEPSITGPCTEDKSWAEKWLNSSD